MSVDYSMRRYPKVPHLTVEDEHRLNPKLDGFLTEGEIYVTEKLDGSNFRFAVYDERYESAYSDELVNENLDEGDLIWGSKKVFRGAVQPDDDVAGNFERALRHVDEVVESSTVRELHDEYDSPLTFYAENMVKHSLSYQWESLPPLLGFDVRLEGCAGDEFLHREEATDVFDQIGLSFVPLAQDNCVSAERASLNYFTRIPIPESDYRDGDAEGVVLRNEDTNQRAKIVSEQFQERLYDRWGKPKSRTKTDTERLVATYCTNARIRKHIIRMVQEEGRDLSMRLMEDLRVRVVEDIWEENWPEIITKNWTVDMGQVWQLVADRCRAVLDAMVTNSSLTGASAGELWE